ncbi:hypothetical protein ACVBEJ_14560, partial [Porticoccus sp. GXU_MW_L64]
CAVFMVVPPVVALGSECVEEVSERIQAWGSCRVAASFNKAIKFVPGAKRRALHRTAYALLRHPFMAALYGMRYENFIFHHIAIDFSFRDC